jgi:hypothetical protein
MPIPPQFLKKKVNPNNDGDGMTESQESPAQKMAEAKNGGKPNAAMMKNAALARMIGKKGK